MSQDQNSNNYTNRELQVIAQESRIKVLKILHNKGTGHWGGASSSAELMTVLYFDRMNIKPQETDWPERDRFILSKGHASTMLYTLLARKGYFPDAKLDSFRDLNSLLQGHPCMNKTVGVEMSTGALGHGLSVGLGMSLFSRDSGLSFWTYVLVGEGCLNEGESWEAVMAAAKFAPGKLVLMVDYNGVQLDGPSDEIMPLDPLTEKFKAFGWRVPDKIYNGHDVKEIRESFTWLDSSVKGPSVIIYHTHKGKGVNFMEDNHKWHGAAVNDDTYNRALLALEAGLMALEDKE